MAVVRSSSLGLPPEALLEVFRWAVIVCNGKMTQRSAPMNISQTCRLWRDLTLATGSLWSRFEFDEEHPDKIAALSSLWLERAKRELLHIHFGCESDYRSNPQPHPSRNYEVWLKDLVSKQTQWKDMNMQCNTYEHLRPIALHGLPNLEFWELRHEECIAVSNAATATEMPFPAFLIPPFEPLKGPIAPKLTFLVIEQRPTGEEGGHRFIEALMMLLRHCPNLENLFIRVDIPIEEEDTIFSFEPIHLVHLQEFFLQGCQATFYLLTRVVAPVLEKITLLALDDEGLEMVPDALKRFFQQSGASLSQMKSIDVSHVYAGDSGYIDGGPNEEDHIQIFEALPNIKYLLFWIPCSDLTCRLLELPNKSKLNSDARGFCPNLTCMNINVVPEVDINVLQDMLSSRFENSDNFTAWLQLWEWSDEELAPLINSEFIKEWMEKGRLKASFELRWFHNQ